jgi:hypothetical protein
VAMLARGETVHPQGSAGSRKAKSG